MLPRETFMCMTKLYPLSCFVRYRAAVAISVINKRVDELARKADLAITKQVAMALAEVWR